MAAVTDLSDDINDTGSLRYAIDHAAFGETITFAPGLAGSIQLQSSLTITSELTIDGAGAGITISGQNSVTDFVVDAGNPNDNVSLRNLTISDGNGTGFSTFSPNDGGNSAGGIYARVGTLNLSNLTFSNNTATGGNGSNADPQGENPSGMPKAAGSGGSAAGAIYVEPNATVASASNLTFSGNTATAGQGGAGDPTATDPEYQTGGADGTAYPDSNDATVRAAAVCFATGTLILTSRGDVPIEALTVGDFAMTRSGTARPIRWVGRRTFDCALDPEPTMVLPIRVRAGAFGCGKPYRDLILSPHHAVAVTCIDEVLIPIRLLVNGSTIAQVKADRVTYWHVELDSHDILLANGLPAESYVDVGNRCDFEGEATLTLHPAFKWDPLAAYCRPLVTGGAVLAAARAQLARYAGEKAGETATPTAFHLLADDTLIPPVVDGHRAAFVVPAGTGDLRLVSPTWSPCDADPTSVDTRRLGLLIQSITIDDLVGASTEIPLDHPGLVAGFHPLERTDFGDWRWTDGDGLLAGSIWRNQAGPFVLRLTGQFEHGTGKVHTAEAA